MTIKRKITKSTGRKGVNYLRSIIEENNCIFQEIELENDVGNDAYIEFISNEEATSFCIGAQIKSGESNVREKYFVLKSDRDHFEYWYNHILPIVGIVYSPNMKKAVWIDITKYLKENPMIINNGPYDIHVSLENEINNDTFKDFMKYYLHYKRKYTDVGNFVDSIEKFCDYDNHIACSDAVKSLFNHRNRKAMWMYLINSFSLIKDDIVIRDLVIALCHLPGHSDIWWCADNIIDQNIRKFGINLIKNTFHKKDVINMLMILDDDGFDRGSIGQCVHAIIDVIDDREKILEQVTFDKLIDEEIRARALFLLIYYYQDISIEKAISLIQRYLDSFSNSTYEDILYEVIDTIEEFGSISFY